MTALEIGIWSGHIGAVLVVAAGLSVALFSRRRLAAFQALSYMFVASVYVLAGSGFGFALWPKHGPEFATRVALVAGPLAGALSIGLLIQWFATERLSASLNRAMVLACAGLALLGVLSYMLPLETALWSSVAGVVAGGLFGTWATWRVARDGDELAWTMFAACCCMLLALSGISWSLLAEGHPPIIVQFATAVAAVAFYLVTGTAVALRVRYYTGISRALRRGTAVDALTQLPTGQELQNRLIPTFVRAARNHRTLVLVGIDVANSRELAQLHGTRARDQAFYALSLRLRATAGTRYGFGRSREDGFVLVVDEPRSFQAAESLAFRVVDVLRRPLKLQAFQASDPSIDWTPDIGVGLAPVVVDPFSTKAAIDQAMEIAAISTEFPSRVGTTDPLSRAIVEILPT